MLVEINDLKYNVNFETNVFTVSNDRLMMVVDANDVIGQYEHGTIDMKELLYKRFQRAVIELEVL